MNSTEKEISYQTTNSYSTLNSLSETTKNVWFVCHGMGYLSRYFLKYFTDLNPKENYIIAPQAQSKYYTPPNFKYVGASWLTKENTIKETENVMRYYDSIFESEGLNNTNKNLIMLGYSQGVSVVMRYMTKRKINSLQLVLLSGGIPKELTAEDFKYLTSTKVSFIYGNKDEYLTEERITHETKRINKLFGGNANIIVFDGIHEVKKQLVNDLIKN